MYSVKSDSSIGFDVVPFGRRLAVARGLESDFRPIAGCESVLPSTVVCVTVVSLFFFLRIILVNVAVGKPEVTTEPVFAAAELGCRFLVTDLVDALTLTMFY
jgi:hypothetical protein